MIDFLNPIIEILPEISYLGHNYLDLRAFLTFIVFVFFCALLFRLGLSDNISQLFFNLVLKLFPGSSIIGHMLKKNADNKTGEYNNVAMIFLDEGWVFGIITEEVNDEGFIMLYVPGAPIPTSGTLYMMPEDKIKRVNIPVNTALSNIWHLGKNADKTLKNKIEK